MSDTDPVTLKKESHYLVVGQALACAVVATRGLKPPLYVVVENNPKGWVFSADTSK